jgi:hypothetical protein
MIRSGALLILVLIALAAPERARAQIGYDRWGGDYASFPVRSGDPQICAARCERDPRCRAWAFSYPGTENVNAMCWLKSRVTPRGEASCCVSGVKGAGVIEPRIAGIEFATDRLGGDFRSFDIPPDPNGRTCQAACRGDPKCRAWTYVRPGYAGANARCYLKDRITRPRKRPCCVSGVLR